MEGGIDRPGRVGVPPGPPLQNGRSRWNSPRWTAQVAQIADKTRYYTRFGSAIAVGANASTWPGGTSFSVAKASFTTFFSPVRTHLFDAARWMKLRPNRWIVSATSKRSCRGVYRTGKNGSFTRVEPHRYNQSVLDIRTFFNRRR